MWVPGSLANCFDWHVPLDFTMTVCLFSIWCSTLVCLFRLFYLFIVFVVSAIVTWWKKLCFHSLYWALLLSLSPRYVCLYYISYRDIIIIPSLRPLQNLYSFLSSYLFYILLLVFCKMSNWCLFYCIQFYYLNKPHLR